MNVRTIVALVAAGCSGPKAAPRPVLSPPAQVPDQIATETIAEGPWLAEVVAGWDSTCVRTRSGKVACFGERATASYEEDHLDSATPVAIDLPPSAQIAAGPFHFCSRDAVGGKVRCWGDNEGMRLGRETPGETDYRALPVPRIAHADQVTISGGTTCVKMGARAMCWGGAYRDEGKLETRVLGFDAHRIVLADPSAEHLCEVSSTVRCFDRDREERNYYGENLADVVLGPRGGSSYGDGERARPGETIYYCGIDQSGVPSCRGENLTGPPSRTIAVGGGHLCGISDGNELWCMGANRAGQVGVGVADFHHEPQHPLDEPVHAVAAGNAHSCAITSRGGLYCWGLATKGQVGLPLAETGVEPTRVDPGEPVLDLFAAGNTTCVKTGSGVRCSGFGPRAACGTSAFGPALAGISDPEALRGDEHVACIQHDGGRLSCRDPGSAGEFTPEETTLPGVGVSWRMMCTLRGGKVACNHFEPDGEQPTAAPFGRLAGFTTISVYSDMVCGLRAGREIVCAEMSRSAYPDEPLQFDKPFKVAQGAFDEVIALSSGVVAVTRERTILAWSTYGGKVESIAKYGDVRVRDLAIWYGGTCASLESGELRCWRGDGKTSNPLPGKRVRRYVAGARHSCALTEEGELWCWGDNSLGQLANGVTFCAFEPHEVTPAVIEAFGGRRE